MWRDIPGRRSRLPQPASGVPLASVPRPVAPRLVCPSAPRSASPCWCAISVARSHQWSRAADWRIRRRRTESSCRAPSCPGVAADGDGCGFLCPGPSWLHCPNRTCPAAGLRRRLPCSAYVATIGGDGVRSDQRCRPFWSPGSCSCPDRVFRDHDPVDVGVVHATDRRRPRPQFPCHVRGTATADGAPCSWCPSPTFRVPRIHVRCRTSRHSRFPCARPTCPCGRTPCPCGRTPSVLSPLHCSRQRRRIRVVRTRVVQCHGSPRRRPDVVPLVRSSMRASRTRVRHASALGSAGSSTTGVPRQHLRHRPCRVLPDARYQHLGRTGRGRRTRCSRAEPHRTGTATADRGPARWAVVRATTSGHRIPCGCAPSGVQPDRRRRPPRFRRTRRVREAGTPPTSRRPPRAPRREPTSRSTSRPRFPATRSWSRSCRPYPSPPPTLPTWSWPPAPGPVPSRLRSGAGCSRTRCGPMVLRCPLWTRQRRRWSRWSSGSPPGVVGCC